MKIKRSWLFAGALWAYFITAYVLYAYLNVAWVKTFDFLLGLAVTLVFAAWYIADRWRYSDPRQRRESGWRIASYGMPYKRRAPASHSPNEAEGHGK